MLLRSVVIQPTPPVYHVPLYNDKNYEFSTNVAGHDFTITVRTYTDYFTYFTIKTDDNYLCINTLAKLGVNLCYAPIMTLQGNQHVFYLHSLDSQINRVHHSLFNNGISLYYYQDEYYNQLLQI